jgi:arylsulfatase A-like enzyme
MRAKMERRLSGKKTLLKPSAYVSANRIVEESLRQMKFYFKKNSIFLWTHFMGAHFPYNVSTFNQDDVSIDQIISLYERFHKKEIIKDDIPLMKAIYENAISYIRTNVDELISQAIDLCGDPVIIITSDHGEGFLEHDFVSHQPHLYDDLLHIPLLSNIQLFDSNEYTSHLDLYEKMLDVAGWNGEVYPSETDLFQEKIMMTLGNAVFAGVFPDPNSDGGDPRISLRTSTRKYILYEDIAGYYDLTNDPDEYVLKEVRDQSEIDLLQERQTLICKTRELMKPKRQRTSAD